MYHHFFYRYWWDKFDCYLATSAGTRGDKAWPSFRHRATGKFLSLGIVWNSWDKYGIIWKKNMPFEIFMYIYIYISFIDIYSPFLMIFRDLTPPSYQIENGIDWDVTCNQQTQRKILRQSDFFWKTLEVLDQEKMPILTKMTWGLPVSPNRCQSPHQKMIQKISKNDGWSNSGRCPFWKQPSFCRGRSHHGQNGLPIRTLKKLMFFLR